MHTGEARLAEAGSVVAVAISGALGRARLEGTVETGPALVALASVVHALSVVVAVGGAGAE